MIGPSPSQQWQQPKRWSAQPDHPVIYILLSMPDLRETPAPLPILGMKAIFHPHRNGVNRPAEIGEEETRGFDRMLLHDTS
jgi:hypothetical protein